MFLSHAVSDIVLPHVKKTSKLIHTHGRDLLAASGDVFICRRAQIERSSQQVRPPRFIVIGATRSALQGAARVLQARSTPRYISSAPICSVLSFSSVTFPCTSVRRPPVPILG